MVPLRGHRGSWDTGGMFRVEIYGRVRRAVLVEGRSQREVAREFGISRKTIQKMLRYAVPPGYADHPNSCRTSELRLLWSPLKDG
jgi:transposase